MSSHGGADRQLSPSPRGSDNKTTTAGLLVKRDPRLRLFDPEWVGRLLMNNLADHGFTDFQQLQPWRRLTPVVADELARFTGQSLVSVQTVLDETYWLEIAAEFAALGHSVLHVVLEADESEMRRRILADERTHRGALAHRTSGDLRGGARLADGGRRPRPGYDLAHGSGSSGEGVDRHR